MWNDNSSNFNKTLWHIFLIICQRSRFGSFLGRRNGLKNYGEEKTKQQWDITVCNQGFAWKGQPMV